MIYLRQPNQFKKQKFSIASTTQASIYLLTTVMAITGMVGMYREYDWRKNVVEPCSYGCVHAVETIIPTPTPKPSVDQWIDMQTKKYGKTRYESNRLKALTHFLLLREQNYGGSDACGDSGKACGPMQFHEPTYIANRKDMIKKGLVKEMGSRLDIYDSIETAIYMFSIGQEKQWGPYLRGEIKL